MSDGGDSATPGLRAAGPLEMLDGALLAVRRGGLESLLQAWVAGAPLALLALAVYYLERIEGVRSLRLPLALALAFGFLFRGVRLSRVARAYALALRSTLPVSLEPTRSVDVACTAGVVGLGLWVWLWPLAGVALLSPFAVAAVLPFVALRGAVAPSWLARAACARERGLAAFGQAFDDTAGMRGVFLIVELLALFGALGLFANLYALGSVAVLLGHSMLGLDMALVSEFLSPDNTLVPLLLAALTLVLLEPLWAAISAQAFVDARSRRDGADLHAAVDAAIAHSAPRRGLGRGSEPPIAAAAVLLALSLCTALPARAQPVSADAAPPSGSGAEADAEVRDQVSTILAGPEFREFAEHDSHALRDLLAKLFDWVAERDDSSEQQAAPLRLPPLSPWVLMALALIALGALGASVGRGRARLQRARALGPSEPEPIAASEPGSLLEQAAAYAAGGDFPAALRALYLASLVALDRGRLIEYEPSKTNWQYIRALPPGELRQSFAAFTRIFDRTWYGHAPATADDYAQCRALAERISSAERS